VTVDVPDPDYYQLHVSREEDGTGTIEESTIQFIVRDTSRGTSERGLRPFVPYPPTPSADAEYVGSTLDLIAPAAFPQGLECGFGEPNVDAASVLCTANVIGARFAVSCLSLSASCVDIAGPDGRMGRRICPTMLSGSCRTL
jgi:hypothetical protein